MRYRKNILVFDTETTGDFSTPFIYDIGWAVLDESLNVVQKREYIVKEIYGNKFLMDSAYYQNKREAYNKRLTDGELNLMSMGNIFKQLLSDIKAYKVNTLAAYNVAFDLRAMLGTLELTSSHELPRWFKLLERVRTLCIWNLACDTILQKQEFKTLALQEKWLSEKGNLLTNAEVAYRYISNDTTFEEDHTALSDVLIEVDILKHILTNEKGFVSYGAKFGAWRKVNAGL